MFKGSIIDVSMMADKSGGSILLHSGSKGASDVSSFEDSVKPVLRIFTSSLSFNGVKYISSDFFVSRIKSSLLMKLI